MLPMEVAAWAIPPLAGRFGPSSKSYASIDLWLYSLMIVSHTSSSGDCGCPRPASSCLFAETLDKVDNRQLVDLADEGS
jgi:hypothetical protein